MLRQDITFRIVVKDEELKELYKENLKKAKFGDRGFDLIVPEDYKIYIGSGSNKINHQVQVAGYYIFEKGTEFEHEHEVGFDVRVRSGTGANTRLRLSNAPGTIDLYRGSIIALIDHIPFTNEQSYLEERHVDTNLGKEYIVVKKGTRLVQLVNPNGYGVVVEFVDELPSTERGADGFGSSGF